MTRKKLSIIIALGFISLLGIILVQLYWIRSAYIQNKVQFEQNVNNALNQVVIDISRKEDLFFAPPPPKIEKPPQHTYRKPSIDSLKLKWVIRSDKKLDSVQKIANSVYVTNDGKNAYSKVVFLNGNQIDIRHEIDGDSVKREFRIQQEFSSNALPILLKDSLLTKYAIRLDSVRELLDSKVFTIQNEQKELNKTLDELFIDINAASLPFGERIPVEVLEQSMAKAIDQYHLPQNYVFALANKTDDKTYYRSKNFTDKDYENSYSVSLYPHALIPRPEILYLNFTKSTPFLQNMVWPIFLLVLFAIILFISLLIIILNLAHHRKLSAIKTDFINNMTHEFKTPIATIQLATDSVMNEQVINEPEKIGYFMRMIKGENKRMNALVERILQMALLEKKSFSLIKTNVDMHRLIEDVAENSKLKVEQVQGEIKLNLKADKSVIEADEVHLTNVLFNLIDNAIKYRAENLQIELSTETKSKQLILTVKDNGMGMSKETIAHIFDKFYRLSQGDVHTIKGYGLGLSYVKAIVEKHGGFIQVFSQPGLGSRFEIGLPIK